MTLLIIVPLYCITLLMNCIVSHAGREGRRRRRERWHCHPRRWREDSVHPVHQPPWQTAGVTPILGEGGREGGKEGRGKEGGREGRE